MKKKPAYLRWIALIMVLVLVTGSVRLYEKKGMAETDEQTKEKSIISSKEHRIEFHTENGKTGIRIITADGETVFENKTPAEIRLMDTSMTEETVLSAGYDMVEITESGWMGIADMESSNGSCFRIEDVYKPWDEGLRMERQISVIAAAEKDSGFASVVYMQSADTTGNTYEDYEYFIPAIIYKDSENITGNAAFAASDFSAEEILVKETRTGLPMTMIRNKATGQTLSITHIADDISDKADGNVIQNKLRVDALCKYGSLGIAKKDSVAAVFRYPYLEAPDSYTIGFGKNVCYHPVEKNAVQNYSLHILVSETKDYNDAMIHCYKEQYAVCDMLVADVDIEQVYETALQDISGYVQERGTGIGLPFAAYVDDGSIFIDAGGNEAVNFQMGFIGMQIPLAYQMIRYGEWYGDEDTVKKGIDMVNFWCDRCGTDSGVVKVWFDTMDFRPYPPFLRIMTDGMEGMLDACQLAESLELSEANTTDWRQRVMAYADFLVEKQNEDGSYWRAYDYSGNAFTDANTDGLIGDANTQGTSKLNSAVPVRFLVRMYEWTKDEKYLNAAIRAGEYVLSNLYNQGKYVGGTADNPNTVDKEAGMYAVYAYSALYGATGESKYLKAMEQAAVYTMSWVYTYKFSASNTENLLAGVPTTLGLNDGLSFIATGHSAVDNMIAYMYYELFKLYVWTEEEAYYEMAHFLQNNTKQTMDLDGKFGYARKSFMIEATGVADMVFGTAGGRGIWLPWISCANVEPISQMEDTFGMADVSGAKTLGSKKLKQQLNLYGAGGTHYQHIR